MKSLRIFRHLACEGPGYLADFLRRQRIPFEEVYIDQGREVPTRLDDVLGLVFMGGPMSVNDPLPWVEQELDLIRRAASQRLPMLGHCLGGQLISKALGGTVASGSKKAIGWYPVTTCHNNSAKTWLKTLPEALQVFHWHGETFTLPPGAVHLLKGKIYPNQAFVLDNILAMQCHIEMTAEMVCQWAANNRGEIATPSDSVQDEAALTKDLDNKINALHTIANVIYTHWISFLKQ